MGRAWGIPRVRPCVHLSAPKSNIAMILIADEDHHEVSQGLSTSGIMFAQFHHRRESCHSLAIFDCSKEVAHFDASRIDSAILRAAVQIAAATAEIRTFLQQIQKLCFLFHRIPGITRFTCSSSNRKLLMPIKI